MRLQTRGLKTIFHKKLEDFTGVLGVTIECNNHQSVSEITDLIWGQSKERSLATGIGFAKISQSIMS